MKYSHNSYWCDEPIKDAVEAGLDAVEFDIVYRLFGNKIFCSHSWRPHNKLYYGTLYEQLDDIDEYNWTADKKIKYIIIESKSFWIPQDKLYKLMKQFSLAEFQFVMSVQSKWFVPWQIPRGIWLKSFYKKYKKKLGIIDKRKDEINGEYLNEQEDLFTKYKNLWQRILHNQF